MLLFGKHFKKTIAEIHKEDPQYLIWLVKELDTLDAKMAAAFLEEQEEKK